MSLRDYKEKKIAIWVAYFIADSREQGRKIRKISRKIDINILYQVSNSLGLNPLIISDKIHPRSGIQGMILVDKKAGKHHIIKMIRDELEKNK
ncbi:signal peptide protein [Sulfolobus acidocaldarius SUSAZ]|nr:signal peptide protein [Sulfolobus acidocaldarius SUSAZ]